MSQREKLFALLQIPQFGAQKISRLLNQVDFGEFCQWDKKQLQKFGWNDKQIQRWFQPERKWIDDALHWVEQENCHIVTLFDDLYPFLLKQISTSPPVLFVKGSVETLSLPQIAMVGSRDYSHYGEYWAGRFATELVKNGLVITSGLAIGIDGFCHQQAIAEGGKTVAVLGSGLGSVYPLRHKRLAEEIVESGGTLVSEFFPSQPPLAENFPRRNRIISGLTLGTLVVEATINSGSLITARYALEQGREVFAIPNTIQNHYASGCHKLIKEGALLVESVEDILQAISLQCQPQQAELFELFQAVEKSKFSAKLPPNVIAKNLPELTACQAQIFEKITLEVISADDLAEMLHLDIATVLVELLNLELLGLLKQTDGGYVRI